MDQGELGLTDNQFWEDIGDHEGRISEAFGERDFQGLVLDGPRQARLSSRDDLPLVGVRACTIRDNVLISMQRRLLLVVARVESDEVWAATAFRINDDARRPATPKDESSIPKGRTTKVFRVSTKERMDDLPWRAGTLQAHLLLFDQRSNPVAVKLIGDDVQDPVVREFLAAQKQPGYPPPVWPAIAKPAIAKPAIAKDEVHPYRARTDSPPVPHEQGIALAIERVVIKRPRATCVVRGSYALPARERDVVRPAPEPSDPGTGWVDVGDAAAHAVLPVTLLLTGDAVADPILVDLHVPVYGTVSAGDGAALATGHFAVDLFELIPTLEAQSYAVWAISREVISQPALVGVVTPEMLPARGEP